MSEEIKNVKTGQITYAVRDTHIDDKEIHEGDIMGIGDHEILAVGKEIQDVTLETIALMDADDAELITVYYGEDTKAEDAEKLEQALTENILPVMWKSMPEVSQSIIMLFLWSNYEYIITAYRAKRNW